MERSFKTAQDRLIKGMRLEGVKTMEAANRYLTDKFLPLWNRRFRVEPALSADTHRSAQGFDFKVIFSVQRPAPWRTTTRFATRGTSTRSI